MIKSVTIEFADGEQTRIERKAAQSGIWYRAFKHYKPKTQGKPELDYVEHQVHWSESA